tara:strand:+ start:185 stop:382 length:198 start_codon:yes stop_codon:yes gene_type:complete
MSVKIKKIETTDLYSALEKRNYDLWDGTLKYGIYDNSNGVYQLVAAFLSRNDCEWYLEMTGRSEI